MILHPRIEEWSRHWRARPPGIQYFELRNPDNIAEFMSMADPGDGVLRQFWRLVDRPSGCYLELFIDVGCRSEHVGCVECVTRAIMWETALESMALGHGGAHIWAETSRCQKAKCMNSSVGQSPSTRSARV